MSVTPNENVLAPGLVAIAGEFVRRQGNGGTVQHLGTARRDESRVGRGVGFPVSLETCLAVDLIQAFRADPHIDEVPHTGWIEFAWNEKGREEGPR